MKTSHIVSCRNIKMTIMTSYFRIRDDAIKFYLNFKRFLPIVYIGGAAGGLGGYSPPPQFMPNFCKIFLFLPQILAFLCLQPPHIPVSPRTSKFTPPPMVYSYQVSSYLNQKAYQENLPLRLCF